MNIWKAIKAALAMYRAVRKGELPPLPPALRPRRIPAECIIKVLDELGELVERFETDDVQAMKAKRQELMRPGTRGEIWVNGVMTDRWPSVLPENFS